MACTWNIACSDCFSPLYSGHVVGVDPNVNPSPSPRLQNTHCGNQHQTLTQDLWPTSQSASCPRRGSSVWFGWKLNAQHLTCHQKWWWHFILIWHITKCNYLYQIIMNRWCIYCIPLSIHDLIILFCLLGIKKKLCVYITKPSDYRQLNFFNHILNNKTKFQFDLCWFQTFN